MSRKSQLRNHTWYSENMQTSKCLDSSGVLTNLVGAVISRWTQLTHIVALSSCRVVKRTVVAWILIREFGIDWAIKSYRLTAHILIYSDLNLQHSWVLTSWNSHSTNTNFCWKWFYHIHTFRTVCYVDCSSFTVVPSRTGQTRVPVVGLDCTYQHYRVSDLQYLLDSSIQLHRDLQYLRVPMDWNDMNSMNKVCFMHNITECYWKK